MGPDSATEASTIEIVVDDRESESGVVEALSQISGVQLAVRRLALGDYQVDDRCLFERKTLVDFASSITDGRLFSQAHRLVSARLPVALILEGKGSDLVGCSMRREALQGAMVSLSLIVGLPVLRSFDPAETARLLIYAAQQLRREANGTVAMHGYRPKGRRKIQLRILQGLPGVGPKRAELLLNTFGRVEAVMTAGTEKLLAVDGFGEKTTAMIRWVLAGEAGSGGTSGKQSAGMVKP